jgi:hypothetical protein
MIKDVPLSIEQNVELLKFSSVKVDIEFVKRYCNSMLLIMKLTRGERILLDFISEQMDSKNFVCNTESLRVRLNKMLVAASQDTYADSTINHSFSKLVSRELLYKVKGKGLYQVNPLFYFKGSEDDRQKVIRRRLETPNLQKINKVRRELIIRKAYEPDQKE